MTWSLILLAGGMIAFTVAALCLPLRAPRHHTLHPHRESPMDGTVWAPGFPHDAPDEPLTVTGALMAMQLHGDCPASCARKTAAAQTLREAHISPSMGVRR